MNISVSDLNNIKHVPAYLSSLKKWNNTLIDSKDINQFNIKIEKEITKEWN